MHAEFWDRYSREDSPIRRIGAGVKLCAALGIVLGIVLNPWGHVVWLVVPAVLLLAVAVISRLPWRFLGRRLLFLEPFVVGVALLAIFQPGGWRVFGILVAKGTLCLLTMILLANTTPFSEILKALRRARVPSLMVTTLSLMYRYMFVLIDETARMKRARASRTFVRQRLSTWRLLAGIAGQLFVRASERAERVWAAMCARGWR